MTTRAGETSSWSNISQDAKPNQVVAVLKAREPARILVAIGQDNDSPIWSTATLGEPVQLLRERSALGRMFCAHVPLLPIFRAGLPQPAPLAGNSDGGKRNRVQQCTNAFLKCAIRPSARTRRLAHPARPAEVRTEVAGRVHPVSSRTRERKQSGASIVFSFRSGYCDNLIF